MKISPLPMGMLKPDGTVDVAALQVMLNEVRLGLLTLWASGTTAQRPRDPVRYQLYYDTTTGQYLYCSTERSGATPAVWTALGGAAPTNLPTNSQSANYTTIAGDAGGLVLHPASDANARTFTIASNASVAYPLGTTITFANQTSQVLSIAIASDTLTLANSTTSGTRSLAQNGVATALKVTTTGWIISGTGLT